MVRCINKPMYVTVAKKHLKDCGSDQISLTSENASLKNYVLIVFTLFLFRSLMQTGKRIYPKAQILLLKWTLEQLKELFLASGGIVVCKFRPPIVLIWSFQRVMLSVTRRSFCYWSIQCCLDCHTFSISTVLLHYLGCKELLK